MLYNVNMKQEMKDGNLLLHLLFDKIDDHDKFLVVTTASTVAYFLQKVKTDLLVSQNDIYYKDMIIGRAEVLEKSVDVIFYMDQVKIMNKKLNPVAMGIGLKAYYNIYFNLYQNNEYYKIEEYYQTIIKK